MLLCVPYARPVSCLSAHAAPGGRIDTVAPAHEQDTRLCRLMCVLQGLRPPLSLRRASRCGPACVMTGVRVHSSILHTPIAVRCHRWPLLCITLLTRLGCHCIQHRSPSQPCRLLQRPCATRARTLTSRRSSSLPGLEARRILYGTSEHADGPAGNRPGTLRLAHPCGTGCAHTAALLHPNQRRVA